MLRLALVNGFFHKGYLRRCDVREHLGLASLAAYLRSKGCEVTLLEPALLGLDAARTAEVLLAGAPDLIGISVMGSFLGYSAPAGPRIPLSLAPFLEAIRARGYGGPIVAGGVLPTVYRGRLFNWYPQIDIVVAGEGEKALDAIVQCVESGRWREIPGVLYRHPGLPSSETDAEAVDNLDILPFPARDVFEAGTRLGMAPEKMAVSVQRGCRLACTTCTLPGLSTGSRKAFPYRRRLPHSVALEISTLARRYSVRDFVLVGDSVLDPEEQAWFCEFASQLRQEMPPVRLSVSMVPGIYDDVTVSALKDCGVAEIILQIDSVLDTDLKLLGKAFTKETVESILERLAGIGASTETRSALPVIVNLTAFHPFRTPTELVELAEWAQSRGLPPYSIARSLRVLEGSRMMALLEQEGLFDYATHCFRYRHPDVEAILWAYNDLLKDVLPRRRKIKTLLAAEEVSDDARDNLLAAYRAQDRDLYESFLRLAQDARAGRTGSLLVGSFETSQ